MGQGRLEEAWGGFFFFFFFFFFFLCGVVWYTVTIFPRSPFLLFPLSPGRSGDALDPDRVEERERGVEDTQLGRRAGDALGGGEPPGSNESSDIGARRGPGQAERDPDADDESGLHGEAGGGSDIMEVRGVEFYKFKNSKCSWEICAMFACAATPKSMRTLAHQDCPTLPSLDDDEGLMSKKTKWTPRTTQVEIWPTLEL